MTVLEAPTTRTDHIRARKARWRSLWVTLHRWFGLCIGAVLAVIALSGCALVFNETLVRSEAGDILFAEIGEGPWRPVSEWIAKAEAKYPAYAPIESVHGAGALPLASGVPVLFKHAERDGQEVHVAIGINPVTAEPTGVVVAEDTWAGFFLLLHVELVSGEIGQSVVAVAGLIGLLLTVTGLYLWWPRPRRWRQALMLRRNAHGPALLLNYHNVPAIWLLAPYVVVLITGLYLVKPSWIDPIVSTFSEIRELRHFETASAPPGACGASTSLDKAIEIGREGRADTDLIRTIWRPNGPQTPYFIEFQSESANPRAGGSVVWVDNNCPKIITQREYLTLTTAETIKSWLWPLHTNLGLGVFGQFLVFATGVLMACLFVTGLWLWLIRRRLRP